MEAPLDDASVTTWLARLRSGEVAALDGMLPLVYDELRALARSRLGREDAGHTLGATALVHEAYLRLAERRRLSPEDRRHFLAMAAQSMRRVLIDHARAKKRLKRNEGRGKLPLEGDEAFLTDEAAAELVALDDALERLARANERAAKVVEQRFFAGLSLEETAQTLGLSAKTVQRDWTLARAWLKKEVEQAGQTSPLR